MWSDGSVAVDSVPWWTNGWRRSLSCSSLWVTCQLVALNVSSLLFSLKTDMVRDWGWPSSNEMSAAALALIDSRGMLGEASHTLFFVCSTRNHCFCVKSVYHCLCRKPLFCCCRASLCFVCCFWLDGGLGGSVQCFFSEGHLSLESQPVTHKLSFSSALKKVLYLTIIVIIQFFLADVKRGVWAAHGLIVKKICYRLRLMWNECQMSDLTQTHGFKNLSQWVFVVS